MEQKVHVLFVKPPCKPWTFVGVYASLRAAEHAQSDWDDEHVIERSARSFKVEVHDVVVALEDEMRRKHVIRLDDHELHELYMLLLEQPPTCNYQTIANLQGIWNQLPQEMQDAGDPPDWVNV